MDSKEFHIGDVLSITTGKLVSLDHIGGVYNILNWMTGDNLMTHQLPRAADECAPALRLQHPGLAAAKVPEINDWDDLHAFLSSLYPTFGERVPVEKLGEEQHTVIDPISEIKMMRPDMPIIGIVTDD